MRGLPNLIAVSRQTDVVNDTITFGNVGYNGKAGVYLYTGRRITGINRPFQIKISYDNSYGDLFYKINYSVIPAGEDFTDVFDPVALGFDQLDTTQTILLNPGDYLYFGVEPYESAIQFAVLTNSLNNDSLISYIDIT
jgi:hypothetical protein